MSSILSSGSKSEVYELDESVAAYLRKRGRSENIDVYFVNMTSCSALQYASALQRDSIVEYCHSESNGLFLLSMRRSSHVGTTSLPSLLPHSISRGKFQQSASTLSVPLTEFLSQQYAIDNNSTPAMHSLCGVPGCRLARQVYCELAALVGLSVSSWEKRIMNEILTPGDLKRCMEIHFTQSGKTAEERVCNKLYPAGNGSRMQATAEQHFSPLVPSESDAPGPRRISVVATGISATATAIATDANATVDGDDDLSRDGFDSSSRDEIHQLVRGSCCVIISCNWMKSQDMCMIFADPSIPIFFEYPHKWQKPFD